MLLDLVFWFLHWINDIIGFIAILIILVGISPLKLKVDFNINKLHISFDNTQKKEPESQLLTENEEK